MRFHSSWIWACHCDDSRGHIQGLAEHSWIPQIPRLHVQQKCRGEGWGSMVRLCDTLHEEMPKMVDVFRHRDLSHTHDGLMTKNGKRCCFPTPRLVVSYVFLHLIFKGCEWLASEISHMKYPHSQATKSAPCMIIHPVKHSWVEVWEIACKEISQCPRFHTSHRFLSIPLAFGAPCRPRAGWIAAFAASFSSISFCLIIDFSFQPKISGARISRNTRGQSRDIECLTTS